MPAGYIAAIVTIAAIPIIWFGAFYLLPRIIDRDTTIPEGFVHSSAILDRVAAEGTLRYDSWQLEPSHRAPATPYTPEEAHKEMQRHRGCRTDICAAKHAAFWTLVDAGHVVTDGRVAR